MKRTLAALIALAAVGCGAVPSTHGAGVSPSPISVGGALNTYPLKFKVLDAVGTPVFCDGDFYPVARDGGEQASADSRYPVILAQPDLYSAIVAHEGLPATDLTEPEKLTLYRAYKLLNAIGLTASGGGYSFQYRVRSNGGSASYLMAAGTVSPDGRVTIGDETPTKAPMCPICLAAASLIATPNGVARVVDLKAGAMVWTLSDGGKRVAVPILEIGSMPVPAGHLMVHLRLADARELLASPGHRTAAGRALGSLAVADQLDGSTVVLWELVPYGGDRTYDILPAGPTGTYWANGILLSSTLAPSRTGL